MATLNKAYKFYSDPGHGWLAVKRAELERLGIADKITSYSYQYGDTVYLEEDCDAGKFFNAKKAANEPYQVKEHITNNRSRIRSFGAYRHVQA